MLVSRQRRVRIGHLPHQFDDVHLLRGAELAVDQRCELVVADRVARLGFRELDERVRLVVGKAELLLDGVQHGEALGLRLAVESHHFHEQRRGRHLQPVLVRRRVRGGRDVLVEKAANGVQHGMKLRASKQRTGQFTRRQAPVASAEDFAIIVDLRRA
jgi:hypothetical protein